MKEIFYKLRGNTQAKDFSEPAAGNATFVIFGFMYHVMCQEVSRCKVVSDRLCITCFFVSFFFFSSLINMSLSRPTNVLPFWFPPPSSWEGEGWEGVSEQLGGVLAARHGQLTPQLLRLYLAVVQVIAISVQRSTFLHTFWNRSILKSTLEEERMLSWQTTLRTG